MFINSLYPRQELLCSHVFFRPVAWMTARGYIRRQVSLGVVDSVYTDITAVVATICAGLHDKLRHIITSECPNKATIFRISPTISSNFTNSYVLIGMLALVESLQFQTPATLCVSSHKVGVSNKNLLTAITSTTIIETIPTRKHANLFKCSEPSEPLPRIINGSASHAP